MYFFHKNLKQQHMFIYGRNHFYLLLIPEMYFGNQQTPSLTAGSLYFIYYQKTFRGGRT